VTGLAVNGEMKIIGEGQSAERKTKIEMIYAMRGVHRKPTRKYKI